MKLRLNKRSLGIARSLAVIGGTGAIVIGATFAATNVGTATLSGNTFSVGTGGVQISTNNSTFGTSAAGFDFGALTVGGTGTTRKHFWLKNNTDSTIGLTAAATGVSTSSNLDPSNVVVHFEKTGTTTASSESLANIESSSITLPDAPAAGATTEYDVWVTLNNGALSTGTTATGTFGLDFTGTTTP